MNGEAASVQLQLNHLARVVHSAPMSNPQRLLCGIAVDPDDEEGGDKGMPDAGGGGGGGGTGGGREARYVHFMFMYESHVPGEPNDNSMQLFFKVPLREEL